MGKFIRKSCFLLSAVCSVVFLFIIAGNLCIPKDVVFYDNQPTVKIHKVFYAERQNSDAISVSTVNNSKNKIALIPRTINLKGTFDNLITATKNKAASTYPQTLSNKNREMMYNIVPPSFTRGSNL